ncbi:Ig-like domain-containing protein [Solimonas soli]|uniref:Ig-like domain-containing protein n=1 Tax=Solimonas soli TaxID=413479 RepID=UPI0004AED317|nr:Ig-like domain-containing protein [Solimonas soli]
MKAVRFLAALFALALVGCGDGSIKSPDAPSVVQTLTISPSTASVALGRTQAFTVTGTCAIAEQAPTACSPKVEWHVSNSAIATIDASGVLTTLAQGTVTVTATADDVTSNTATVTVGAPVLESLAVFTLVNGQPTTSSSATVALGSTQAYKVFGRYSNSTDPEEIDVASTPITWASGDAAIATVSPTTGVVTNATPVAVGTTTIIASTTNSEGTALSANGTIVVTNAALVSVARIEPSTASVAIGNTQTFHVYGAYADGSEAEIPATNFDWTSSDPTRATVDANGVATGVAVGSVTIKATLKAAVPSSGSTRSASASLGVTNAACVTALLASQGATTAVAADSILGALGCLGCIVDDENKVIDADPTNYANMVVPVGLLGGNVSLTVSAAGGTVFDASTDAPHTAGFVIGRKANQLLSAELLSQIEVSTLLDGVVQESGTAQSNFLRLTLLGLLGDNQQALVSVDATKNFDAIRLTYNSGVLSALTTTQIYSACSTAVAPAE